MYKEFFQERASRNPSCLGDPRSSDTSSMSSDPESVVSSLGVISEVVTESEVPGSTERVGLESVTGAAVLPHNENNPKTPEDAVGAGVGRFLDGGWCGARAASMVQ